MRWAVFGEKAHLVKPGNNDDDRRTYCNKGTNERVDRWTEEKPEKYKKCSICDRAYLKISGMSAPRRRHRVG